MASSPKININPVANRITVGGQPVKVKATAPAPPPNGTTGIGIAPMKQYVPQGKAYVKLPKVQPETPRQAPAKPRVPQSVSGSFQLLTPKQAKQAALPPTTDKPRNTTGAGSSGGNSSAGGGTTPANSVAATAPGANVTLPPLPGSATYQPVAIPNTDPYGGQSPAAVVAGMLAPQYNVVNQSSVAQQAALKAFAAGVAQQLSQVPSEVAGNYTQAQNVTDALASHAADLLSAANPNSQDQQLLQSIGAPQAQQDALASKLGNAFNGGVLYQTQGANAGAALAAQKAAAQTYADALPGIQGLAATNAERNLLYQVAQQKAAIAAQAPTLENQVAAAKANALYQQATLRADQNKTIADNAIQRAAYNQNNIALGVKTRQNNFDNNVRLQQLSDAELRQAQDYGIKVATLRANEKKYAAQTAATRSKTMAVWSKFWDDAYHGVAPKYHYDKNGVGTPVPGTGKPPIAYAQAIKQAVMSGQPYQLAVADANNLYAPGEGGRPSNLSLSGALTTAGK